MQTNLSALLDYYISYLELEKNASPKTVENYTLWINRFVEFTKDADIKDIKKFTVLDFRRHLGTQNLSLKTVNYHVIALRAFLKFLLINDIEALNPQKLELSKLKPREVSFLTEDEVKLILSGPEQFEKDEITKKRDEAILHTLYGSWLRVSELIWLRQDAINLDQKQYRLIWKWSKMRSVFFSNTALEKLSTYLNARSDSNPFVFISHSNNSLDWKGLTRVSIETTVKKYAMLVWITKKVTPHTLRHSFATSLLMKWADIRSVQALLGHASITTTQIYTHVADQHLQKVHDLLD